jgi:hypothetical protein
MKVVKTYLFCVYANKVTLVGYIILILYFISFKYPNSTLLEYLFPPLLGLTLGSTMLGLGTFKTYKKLLTIGNVDKAVRTRSNYTMYCDKVGYKLAIKKLRSLQTR